MDRLAGQVAIVTGAGRGLGREYALGLARRGAAVIVNDLGAARDGEGSSTDEAQAVVDEIRALGGRAIRNGADITDFAQVEDMVREAERAFGAVSILVNNAGILRDRTFAKLDLDDFRKVLDVHLMGAVHCTKALWDGMRARSYGRVVFTTSSSGLYGNFGQSNYAAAKLALVGLMNTLRLEGEKYGIRVNCISPSAATRMTGDVLDDARLTALAPAHVAPAVVALCDPDAPNGVVLCAGAGSFERAYVTLTRGHVQPGATAEDILAHFHSISDREGELVPGSGPEQAMWEVDHAAAEVAMS